MHRPTSDVHCVTCAQLPFGTPRDALVFYEFHSDLWDRLGYNGLLLSAREWDAERLSWVCESQGGWLHGLLSVRFEQSKSRPLKDEYPSHLLPRKSFTVTLFGKVKDARYLIPSWSAVEIPAPGSSVGCVWWQAPEPWKDVPDIVQRMGCGNMATFEVHDNGTRCRLTLDCDVVWDGLVPGKEERKLGKKE